MNLHDELVQAGFDAKRATVSVCAIDAGVPSATPTWPIPITAAVLSSVGVYKNGRRIDAVRESLTEVESGLY